MDEEDDRFADYLTRVTGLYFDAILIIKSIYFKIRGKK